jgi:hypothetical protein
MKAVGVVGPDYTPRLIEVDEPVASPRADSAIHVTGDMSVAAGVVRPGGRFTSVALGAAVPGSDADYLPTEVAPSGHKLADLLFKVAAHRLHSCVGWAFSFDQIGDAIKFQSGNVILIR